MINIYTLEQIEKEKLNLVGKYLIDRAGRVVKIIRLCIERVADNYFEVDYVIEFVNSKNQKTTITNEHGTNIIKVYDSLALAVVNL